MKKIITVLSILCAIQYIGNAQNSGLLDSLRNELSLATNDSVRVRRLLDISIDFSRNDRSDSSIFYANKALVLARKTKSPELEIDASSAVTLRQIGLGNLSRALKINLEAIRIAEKNSLIGQRPGLYDKTGSIYLNSGNFIKALNSFRETIAIADSTHQNFFIVLGQIRLAETFYRMNQPDSALYYANSAGDNIQRLNMNNLTLSNYLNGILVPIFLNNGENEHAIKFIREHSGRNARIFEEIYALNFLAQAFHQMGIPDSSIYYANKALDLSIESKNYSLIIQNNILLSEIYEKQEPAKALQYSRAAIAYKDTFDNYSKNATLDVLNDFDEQERQYEIEKATVVYRNKIQRLWIFSIAGALLSALFVTFILYRNNKNKQKANKLLQEQKVEIETQKQNVEETLKELKSTQAQLIQSEKMASLGELTAGIAHEIQNPLNFVNNFSEVSSELVDELQDELNMNNPDVAREISNDIKKNLDKINHHGKRADGIVKSMLQHSRSSTGEKEATDINALCDEYLRLAYHGMCAKDKSFSAEFKTDFDESIPRINLVPQDMGRVLLNLINNAFQVVSSEALAKEGSSYQPEVDVSTMKLENQIEIRVSDNGPGIPDAIKDKIFQPFFTTKPTGQGTGLGLSLAYDIVKAHRGELIVKTKVGEFHTSARNYVGNASRENDTVGQVVEQGTEFIIQLPIG